MPRVTCFQVVKTILDRLYPEMPGEDQEKDGAIVGHLESLSEQYKGLGKGVQVDYDHPAARFAYMFAYSPCHTYLVYRTIANVPKLRLLFERPTLNIACLGGGPGSDLLGIAKYILSQDADRPYLRFSVLDRQPGWENCWRHLHDSIAGHILDIEFQTHHVTSVAAGKTAPPTYPEADLITMVY